MEDVPDVVRLEVPMELRLELGAVIRLHDVDAEGYAPKYCIDELAGRALGARVVYLQDANPGAVVDGGELIQPSVRSRDSLQELHIELQPMPRLRFLVPLPSFAVRLMLLIRWQPVYSMPLQDAMHRGAGDLDEMNALSIRGDAGWPKVRVLAEVENLAHHLASNRSRRLVRRPWPIA
jgi:hypothetical protein